MSLLRPEILRDERVRVAGDAHEKSHEHERGQAAAHRGAHVFRPRRERKRRSTNIIMVSHACETTMGSAMPRSSAMLPGLDAVFIPMLFSLMMPSACAAARG